MSELEIVRLHIDPLHKERLRTGKFRINKELNEEWIDIKNTSIRTINMRGRVLASFNSRAKSNNLDKIFPRKARIVSDKNVPLYPGEILRIYTGEQPYNSTYIPDQDCISRVIWLLYPTYLWTYQGDEAHIYLDMNSLRNRQEPLARYSYSNQSTIGINWGYNWY